MPTFKSWFIQTQVGILGSFVRGGHCSSKSCVSVYSQSFSFSPALWSLCCRFCIGWLSGYYGYGIWMTDWFFAQSLLQALCARDLVSDLCNKVGILVSLEKLHLQPSQSVVYLRMWLDSQTLTAFPTLKWVQKLQCQLEEFLCNWWQPANDWSHLLGPLASLYEDESLTACPQSQLGLCGWGGMHSVGWFLFGRSEVVAGWSTSLPGCLSEAHHFDSYILFIFIRQGLGRQQSLHFRPLPRGGHFSQPQLFAIRMGLMKCVQLPRGKVMGLFYTSKIGGRDQVGGSQSESPSHSPRVWAESHLCFHSSLWGRRSVADTGS